MSNTPNMSYCMFENTAAAMRQILDAMRDAEENGYFTAFVDDLNREERIAMRQLALDCADFLEACETK